jgi:hypothetical protein
MTRRTRTTTYLVASVAALALAGCAQSGGASTGNGGQGGLVSLGNPSASASPSTTATQDTTDQNNGGYNNGGSNSGNGSGNGGHSSPSPSTTPTGPRIVSFTATGAVCPVTGTPYADRPGQVTISWKIANADTVDLYMDGGLWHNGYPGTQGSDTLPFQCPDTSPSQKTTHTFMLVIKNTNVKKSISASAQSNPKGMGP